MIFKTEIYIMIFIWVINVVRFGKKHYVKVRRVQKHIETLDMLRMARENSISLKNEEKNLARESKVHCGDHMQGRQGNPKKQQPLKHSESVVVTTKWETFD